MSTDQQLQLARTTRGESSHLSRAARQVVPPFLQKLYEIVNDPANDELIRWSENGDSFYVLNHEKFAREVLGRWFKHQKFTSFVRQLNMYGFHKIPHLQQGVLRSDSDTEPWHFEHPHFHRGQPDLLCLIQRKKQPPHGAGEEAHLDINEPAHTPPPIANLTAGQLLDINSVVNGIAAIKRHQQAISSELNELKSSNQHLWQEALAARERHKRHQDTINRILKFLAGVFGRNADNEDKHESHADPLPRAVIPRKRQRLMIGDGRNEDKGKVTMVEEIDEDDDGRRKSFESAQEPSRYSSDPYGKIETPGPSIRAHSVGPSDLFSPSPSEVSNGFYEQPLRPAEIISRSSTAEPTNHGSNPGSGSSPSPNGQTLGNGSLVSPPSNIIPSSFVPNTQPDPSPQMWAPAIQQLLSSPTQFQRILQALQHYPVVPPSDPTAPPPSIQTAGFNVQPQISRQVTTYDPSTYDFSRFKTDLPSDQGTVGDASSFHLLGPEDEGPSIEPLVQNAQQLHKSYQDAQEIDADVDALQYSLNSLIENLGLDPNAIIVPPPVDHDDPVQSSVNNPGASLHESSFGPTNGLNPTSSIIPPLHPSAPEPSTADNMAVDPTVSDFDFDAFLNELDTRNPGDHVTDYSSRFDSVPTMDGMVDETNPTEPLPDLLDEEVSSNPPAPTTISLAGGDPTQSPSGGGSRKRKSDVVEFTIPTTASSDTTSPASPKVKRKR